MIRKLISISFVMLASCAAKDKYNVNSYYDLKQQDKVLPHILSYIMDAPPMVSMTNRFKPEHQAYYSLQSPKFPIVKFFVADDGTHYYYVMRPTSKLDEKRGAGGHFKMTPDYQISEFREVFVTQAMPETDVRGRAAFLFDEMVKGNIDQYLKMESYIQWPNEATYYDTLTYEWKLKPELQTD